MKIMRMHEHASEHEIRTFNERLCAEIECIWFRFGGGRYTRASSVAIRKVIVVVQW